MELPDLPARNERGEVKRVHDLRQEMPVITGKNRGFYKGKALEQSRIVYHKKCLFCCGSFEGIATAKYCSESCKQKSKRLRQKTKLKVYKRVDIED